MRFAALLLRFEKFSSLVVGFRPSMQYHYAIPINWKQDSNLQIGVDHPFLVSILFCKAFNTMGLYRNPQLWTRRNDTVFTIRRHYKDAGSSTQYICVVKINTQLNS